MRLLVLCPLLFVCWVLSAQDPYLKSDAEMDALSQVIAERFASDDISGMIGKMRVHWPLPQDEVDNLEQKTIKSLNMVKERFGPTIGVEKIKQQALGQVARRDVYLIRYTYTAIRLHITYYQSKDGWIINSFYWDDSFDEEFD